MATVLERPRRLQYLLIVCAAVFIVFTCPISAGVCETRTSLGFLRHFSTRREAHCREQFARSGVQESTCPNSTIQPTCCTSSDCLGDSVCDCAAGCGRPVCLFRLNSGARSHLCPPLVPPSNSRLTSGHQPYTATIHCNNGYFLKGSSTLLCGKHNQWIRPAKEPQCIRITCTQPTLPQGMTFASRLRQHYASGDGLRIKCARGFVFRVNKRKGQKWRQMRSLRCRKSGNWSPRHPKCYPKKRCCAKPQAPVNGTVIYSSATQSFCMGESVTFSCNKCFRNVGKDQHVCTNPLESSSQSEARCEEIRCAAPDLPYRAFIDNGGKHSARFSCDSSLKIRCSDDPQQLLGPTTITCNEDGSWTGPLPKCAAPTKPRKVRAINQKSTSIKLKWRPPSAGSRSVTHYKVKYSEMRTNSIQQHTVLIVNVSDLEIRKRWYHHTVTNLQPCTEYSFFVAGIAGNHTGAESNKLLANTSAGVPSPPRALEAKERVRPRSSLPSLFLSWRAPLHLNCPVKYLVAVSTRHPVAKPYIREKRFDQTRELKMYVKSLQPFTEYNISIIATTGKNRYSGNINTTATLKSRLFRPRSPPKPTIKADPPVTLLIHASEDRAPFARMYEVHVSRVAPNKNSIEGSVGSIDQSSKLEYTAAQFSAEDFDNIAIENRTKRLVLGDTSLHENNRALEPGKTYIFQTRIRTPAGTKSWSEKTEYTAPVQDNNLFSSR